MSFRRLLLLLIFIIMNLFKKSLIGLFVFITLFSAGKIFADNTTTFSVGSGNCNWDGIVSLNKINYDPGEQIIPDSQTTSLVCPGYQASSISANGSCFYQNGFTVCPPPFNLFAPNTAGNYEVEFDIQIDHIAGPDSGSTFLQYAVVPPPTPPTVINPTATSITQTSAILGANVSSLGVPATISARGVCVTTSPPAVSNCFPEGGTTLGVFSKLRTELSPGVPLTPNTTYYYSGYATNATGTTYSINKTFKTIASSSPQVTLSLDPERPKDLVKKSNPNEIGTSYLIVYVNNLPTNQSCILKQINGDSYGTYGNDDVSYSFPVSSLSKDINQFQLQCTNSANNSSIVEVKGQSGTLNSSNPSCTISSGQNSCTIPSSWTTINPNPDSSIKTEIVNLYNNSIISLGTGVNGTSTLTIPGAVISTGSSYGEVQLESRNKVDGETSGTAASNTLDNLTVDVYCATGSVWDGSICALPNLPDLPDLIASNIGPTSAVINVPRVFGTSITNQGGSSTGTTAFSNIFQIATGFDDPTGQIGPLNVLNYQATNPNPMSAIAPGASKTASRSFSFNTAGTIYMRACADLIPNGGNTGSSIDEGENENNNCSPQWIPVIVSVIPQPDLTAGGVNPTQAVNGVASTYTATIRNNGTASTGQAFSNIFQTATGFDVPAPDYIGPENLTTDIFPQSMAPLAAGASAQASIERTFSTGTYYVRACADLPPYENNGIIGSVDEGVINENNNCGPWSQLIVDPIIVIDLHASNPPQTTATIGTPLDFTSYISNSGNTTTGTSFYNIFQLATGANGTGTISTLTSTPSPMPALLGSDLMLATTTNSYTFTGSPRVSSIRACANQSMWGNGPNFEVPASNSTNNCSDWVNITVTSSANPTGSISAVGCNIPIGSSSCNARLNWDTLNPTTGVTSVVAKEAGVLVRTGNKALNHYSSYH
jgi:hypothetical protein